MSRGKEGPNFTATLRITFMERRKFLAAAAGLAIPPSAAAIPATVIDTHTHFYDTARPQGVPWPPTSEKMLYRPVLPDEFVRMTKPLGVTGTIEVEASAWLEDNQWVLDLAAKHPVIVGTVGHLEPGTPDFRKTLARFHKNPLFRGIRLGAAGGRGFAPGLPRADFISDMRALADAGLELDAIGGPSLLPHLVWLTDQVPALRIVINHLPFDPPAEAAAAYQTALRELGTRALVYAKVSNVPRRSGERVPAEVGFYRPALDELWEVFGEDRLIYGSNWPVSARIAPYETAFKVVREYFAAKGQEASEKYFWKNSKVAYRWGAA
jgi:L-fuconolactonase